MYNRCRLFFMGDGIEKYKSVVHTVIGTKEFDCNNMIVHYHGTDYYKSMFSFVLRIGE